MIKSWFFFISKLNEFPASNFHSHNLSPYCIPLKKRCQKSWNCPFMLNARNWEKHLDTKEKHFQPTWQNLFFKVYLCQQLWWQWCFKESPGPKKPHTIFQKVYISVQHWNINCLLFRENITLEYNSISLLWLILPLRQQTLRTKKTKVVVTTTIFS